MASRSASTTRRRNSGEANNVADESKWQNHVDSKERGAVSRNVRARRHGEVDHPQDYLDNNPKTGGSLHAKGREKDAQDDRTTHERLLDGETIDTSDL